MSRTPFASPDHPSQDTCPFPIPARERQVHRVPQRANALCNSNRLKLGLFSLNADGGIAITKVPERWQAGWPETPSSLGLRGRDGGAREITRDRADLVDRRRIDPAQVAGHRDRGVLVGAV